MGIALAFTAHAADIDMLVIGDSITEGSDFPPGFRDDLSALLDAEPGHTFTWLGSEGSPPINGHFDGGREVEDFYPAGFGNNWGNGTFDVTPAMGPTIPNLVAIHLGTNDLNSQPPPFAPYSLDHGQTLNPSQSGQLAEFLLYLLQWQDGTQSTDLQHIVLSMIIPMENRDQDVTDWNDQVIAMSEDFGEGLVTGTPVRIALADHFDHFLANPDLFTFGPGDWMFDPLHPNDDGYTEMAGIYHPAIVETVEDATAPSPILDLAVATFDSLQATIDFTATGDDFGTGQAARYDLRLDTVPIDDLDFGLARQLTGEPAPAASGNFESLQLDGLLPGTTYYVAIKAVDDGGNRSDISNLTSFTTMGTPTVVLTLREGLDGYFGAEDNTLIDLRPNDNLGAGTNLGIGQHGSVTPQVVDINRLLIRFDLSQIPANATVLDARLQLYNYLRESSTPVDAGAYRVTKRWVEGTRSSPSPQAGTSTWNDARQGELDWSSSGVEAANDAADNNDPDFDRFDTAEDIIELDGTDQWYEWDVTDAAGRWVTGEWQNDGMLVQTLVEEPNNRRRFYSSESTVNQSLRPTLLITISTETEVGIADMGGASPVVAQLFNAYPNPFRSNTAIRYELVEPGAVRLKVYDVTGRMVRTLLDSWQGIGSYNVDWDRRSDRGEQVAAGVYFYELVSNTAVETRKLVVSP